jgi:hypothetical protein
MTYSLFLFLFHRLHRFCSISELILKDLIYGTHHRHGEGSANHNVPIYTEWYRVEKDAKMHMSQAGVESTILMYERSL